MSEGEKRASVTVTCVRSKLDGNEALPHAGGARKAYGGAVARGSRARAHGAL